MGFLDKYRDSLPRDIGLYAGGEDNFCHRVLPTGTVGMFSDFGYLDRRAPLFVSPDPERDTPSVLARYVSRFQPRLIGLTGTREQVRAVADSYKAYYAQYVPPAV
jgi:hypothetical protein